MEELKAEATELGLDFKGNISKAKLQEMVDAAKNPTAESSSKEPTEKKLTMKKIKVSITPRDPEEKEGYVGFNGYNAQYQFDTPIEMPEMVVEFLKTKGGYVMSSDGSKKWQSRYLIEVL